MVETVGYEEVSQQTPRAVTAESPSSVTFPPPVAVVSVISLTLDVVTVGRASGSVVKLKLLP